MRTKTDAIDELAHPLRIITVLREVREVYAAA
jgi:hypothetical protein